MEWEWGRIRQGMKVTVWGDLGADKSSVTFGKRESWTTFHFLPLKTWKYHRLKFQGCMDPRLLHSYFWKIPLGFSSHWFGLVNDITHMWNAWLKQPFLQMNKDIASKSWRPNCYAQRPPWQRKTAILPQAREKASVVRSHLQMDLA